MPKAVKHGRQLMDTQREITRLLENIERIRDEQFAAAALSDEAEALYVEKRPPLRSCLIN